MRRHTRIVSTRRDSHGVFDRGGWRGVVGVTIPDNLSSRLRSYADDLLCYLPLLESASTDLDHLKDYLLRLHTYASIVERAQHRSPHPTLLAWFNRLQDAAHDADWFNRLRDDDACVLCEQEAESGDHLLIGCVVMKELWCALLTPLGLASLAGL